MNDLQVFQNSEFGELSVLNVDGKPYFPAKDVAKVLGYKDATNAIKRHCRWVVKRHLPHPQSPSKTLTMNFITEGDLYRLIAHSKLPAAERFEKWVFDEVLPSIRQTGSYGQPDIAAIVAQTATTVCTEMIRQLAPLIQSLVPQSGAPVSATVPQRRRKQHKGGNIGIIERLNDDRRAKIEEMLRDEDCTYTQIAEMLEEDGIKVSRMTISRYAQRTNCYPDYNRDTIL